jgi:hypothetical protein
MEKYYGNYLGIVINDQDPEGRNRVQVWIPHLTNTLFSDWNNNDGDKQIEDLYSDVPITLINRLKNILPWAECAAPLIGGGSAVMNNVATNSGDSSVPPVDSSDNQLDFTSDDPAMINDETGETLSGAPENDNELLEGDLPGDGAPQAAEGTIGGLELTATPVTLHLNPNGENALTTLPEVQTSEVKFKFNNTNTNLNKATPELLNVATNFASKFPNGVITSGSEGFDGDGIHARGSAHYSGEAIDVRTRDITDSQLKEYVNFFASQPDVDYILIEGSHLHVQTKPGKGGAVGVSVKGAPTPSWIQESKSLFTSVKAGTPSDFSSAEDSSIVALDDPTSKSNPAYGTQGHGNSKGTFSNTTVGAKVWMFFYGGDIQKPVYFAHSMSASEYLTS